MFIDSLRLCAEAGLASFGAVTVDGTKIAANASIDRNRASEDLTKAITTIVNEAGEIDTPKTQRPPGTARVRRGRGGSCGAPGELAAARQ